MDWVLLHYMQASTFARLRRINMNRIHFVMASSFAASICMVAPRASAFGFGGPDTPQAHADTAPPATPGTPQQSTTMTPGGAAQTSTTTTTSAEYADMNPAQRPLMMSDTVTESPVNRPMLVTSSVILVGSYVPAAITAATSDRKEDERLYIPVAGPWLDLANRDCSNVPCNNETLNKTLLIGGGVLQGAAAIGLITSFFVPEKKTRNWWLIGSKELTVSPVNVAGGAGLSAFGQF